MRSEARPRARRTAATPPSRRARLPALVYIVGVALLVRLVVLWQLGTHPSLQPAGVLDDAVYVQLANRVAGGDLALGPAPYFLSPFYTYFLGLVFALSGGSLLAARIAQILLGTVAVVLIARMAGEWFGRTAGLLAGTLAAVTGVFVFNEILILQSSVDVFLASLALFALTRAVRSGSMRAFAATGLVLGFLSINRPNALPCLLAVAFAWLVLQRRQIALRQAGILLLGAALVLLPVGLRNRVVSGEFVLVSSHGGLNFYIGNFEEADGTWRSVDGIRPWIAGQAEDAERVASQALGRNVSAGEASSYFYRRAWDWIDAHPAAWAKLLARKIALTFTATDIALNYSYSYFSRDEGSLLSALVVGPWLVIPLGLVGLVIAAPRRERGPYVTWALWVPVYAASVAAFFVSSRYRLPLLVPLTATAGGAIAWFWDRRAALASRTVAAATGALVAIGVLVNWPLQPDTGRMFERGERIVRLFDEGRVADGERLLRATESRHPDPGLLLYRIGLTLRQRGDTVRAIEYLERAWRADPRETRIRFNLGEALYEAGRASDAIPHLEAARAAGLEPATVRIDLAGAYHATGHDDLARGALASIVVTPTMDAAGLIEIGRTALDVKDPTLAERYFREAIGRAPGLAAAHFYLAVSLAQRGQLSDARQAAEEALRLQPDMGDARALLSALPATR